MANNLNNPIDLNHSSQAELQTLPGIGPVLARRIMVARPFTSFEDLRRVEGIDEITLEQLHPLVTVSPIEGEAAPDLSSGQQAAQAEPAETDSNAVLVEGEAKEAMEENMMETAPEQEEISETAVEPRQEEVPAKLEPSTAAEEAFQEGTFAEEQPPGTMEAAQAEEILPEASLQEEALAEGEKLPESSEQEELPSEEKPREEAEHPDEETQEESELESMGAAQEMPPIGSVPSEEPRPTEAGQASPAQQPHFITRGEAFWITAGGIVISSFLAAAFVLIFFFVLNGSLHYARLSALNRLGSQTAILQSDVSSLQSGLSEVQSGLKDLQGLSDRVGTLEGDAAQSKSDLDALQGQYNDLDGKLSTLTTQVDNMVAQTTEMSQQLDTLSGNVVTLQNLTKRFQDFFDGLRGLLETMSQP